MDTLVGSRAIKHWFSDFREPNDYDYVTTSNKRSNKEIEYHPVQNPGHQWIVEQGPIASPEIMLTIKMSHSFWDVHWPKTMSDILFLQRKKVQYIPHLFDKLYKYWTFVHGHKKAYLDVNNEEFFTTNVERKYEHDDIHAAISYYDEPLYKKVKRDQSKAAIDYDLFLALSFEDKLILCREEIYVVALERFLIPSGFKEHRFKSYFLSCKQLITSMTKGWFPKFIVENWSSLYREDNHPWINKFRTKLCY